MKKKHIALLSILLTVVLVVGGFFLFNGKLSKHSAEKNAEDNKTITFANGDSVFIPSNEDIGYDDEEEIYYYENMLNIYLSSEVSDKEADDLAETVDGTVVGKLDGAINMLQFQVEKGSINDLHQLANSFEENEAVEFATTSTPSVISDLNDTTEGSQENDEANFDWWPEAINAPGAWEYIEDHESLFKDVKVGVLEVGRLGKEDKDIHDADLQQSVEDVSNKNGTTFESENCDKESIYKSHARWVTKFIAADQEENPHNFRGVATDVSDVHFTALGNESDNFIEGEKVNGVPEPYIFSIIESEIDKGVKVINNSWGFPPNTKEKWEEAGGFWNTGNLTYNGYLKSLKKSQDKVSAQLIVALDRLLSENNLHNEFLIIQGAGNGKSLYQPENCEGKNEESSAETATESINSGFFTNINEDTLKEANKLQDKSLDEKVLEEILNHIIIVGGAEPTSDGHGYQVPEWASYGDAIDIVAPASDLLVDTDVIGENDQIPVKGTSFATPMVSGAAALVWSYNPGLTAREVKNLLVNSAEETVKDNDKIIDEEYTKQSYPMLNMNAFKTEYHDLIELYRKAVSERWYQDQLDNYDLGPAHYHPKPLSFDYGYELRDINGNGNLELILGLYQDDGEAEVHEIYTLQNGEPVQVFVNGIRTNVSIYDDGTISQSDGAKSLGYYTLNDDGSPELIDGYETINQPEGKYKSVTNPEEALTQDDVDDLHKEYNDKRVEHLFTPFVLGEEGIPEIVKENYNRLKVPMLDVSFGQTSLDGLTASDLFQKHHDEKDVDQLWKKGIDPKGPFYKDMYDLMYPGMEDLSTKEGMEFIIHETFMMIWKPATPSSFFGSGKIDVLEENNDRFKVKQTITVGPHDVGGESYDIVYILDYVKEDDQWKFAGGKEEK